MYRTPLYNGHNFEVPMVSATESFTVLKSDFFFPVDVLIKVLSPTFASIFALKTEFAKLQRNSG